MAKNTAFQLTLLTSLGVKAVKTFLKVDGKIQVEGYGRAKQFTAETIDCDADGAWLKALRKKKFSFVVLGEPVNWKKGEKKRRLSVDRDGEDSTLKDVPRALMPIDVDQIDFDPSVPGFDDGESLAYDVMDRLGLRGVKCVWHLTSSHGFFKKHRIRLWLELATPATAAEMKSWAKDRWGDDTVEVEGKQKHIVDLAVYQAQQPIYTGDPILEGVDDPCSKRVGVIDGDALEMELPKKRSSKSKKNSKPEDDNVALLEEAGMYIGRLKAGQHMIRCPWEDVHTGGERDDDTFYFEPHHNGHDIPAFKCHHGSCEGKKWADVVEFIGKEVDPAVDDRAPKAPNWVFIYRMKAFWDARDGAFIDRESYDATHGGKSKDGTPTDRFLAMKKSQKCDVAEFLPGVDRFVTKGRLRVLNTYVDQRVEPEDGDATPWVELLEWLVPNDRDRGHLMDWLAWTYQRPGEKITWAPILYSKSHGVGKTTVFDCLAECVGRTCVSEPTQAELEDKFNDWVFGKLLVKIEELMSGDKYHVAEKLKPVVSNQTLSIRRMHQTGFSVQNVANVAAITNHMQALPLEDEDRRWMMIQCVEAPKSVRRPKMKAFHKWLESAGHGVIAHWLATRDVSEFQPKGEAPMTALKKVVIEASRTDIDRAVDLCDVFDGSSIISSAMVKEYLSQNDCAIAERRIGLIAARRGWVSLPGQEGRARIGNLKVTFWTSQGRELRLRAFLAKKPSARETMHSNLMARMVFDDAESAKDRESL